MRRNSGQQIKVIFALAYAHVATEVVIALIGVAAAIEIVHVLIPLLILGAGLDFQDSSCVSTVLNLTAFGLWGKIQYMLSKLND